MLEDIDKGVSMFPNNVHFLGRERDKERMAEAEHLRLVKVAKGQQSSYWGGLRTFANWLGQRLIEWGEKLSEAGSTPVSEVAQRL